MVQVAMKSAIYSEVENRILITIKFGEFFHELLIIRDAVISKTRESVCPDAHML